MRSEAPLCLVISVLVACSGRPPPPSGVDSSAPDRDAGPEIAVDAGNPGGLGRPDGGPLLPSTDREIVLPYFGDPVTEDLVVEGTVGTLDVFFSIDTTGSFAGEIDNLQATLRSRILPELRDRVADVQLGVGRFEDFPGSPYGDTDDLPFELLTEITSSESAVASAVASLDQPLGNGADIDEAGGEALWQIATGEGYPSVVPAYRGSGLGGVGFREDALRAVVHVTDAPAHRPSDYGSRFPGTHSITDATRALRDLGVRVLGISSGSAARSDLEELALGTGAFVDATDGDCETGIDGAPRPARDDVCPLVFDVNPDGSGVGDTIVDAIVDLLSTIEYDEVWAETDDSLAFVRTLEAREAEPPPGIEPPGRGDLRPAGDDIDDTFLGVGPGTRLAFRAVLRNETIPPADYDQIFNIVLRVVGDGVTLLTRTLRIVVPRGRLDAGVSDAGLDAALPDAGHDAGSDAGHDAGTDAGLADASVADAGPPDAG